jgi:hypothetical protein
MAIPILTEEQLSEKGHQRSEALERYLRELRTGSIIGEGQSKFSPETQEFLRSDEAYEQAQLAKAALKKAYRESEEGGFLNSLLNNLVQPNEDRRIAEFAAKNRNNGTLDPEAQFAANINADTVNQRRLDAAGKSMSTSGIMQNIFWGASALLASLGAGRGGGGGRGGAPLPAARGRTFRPAGSKVGGNYTPPTRLPKQTPAKQKEQPATQRDPYSNAEARRDARDAEVSLNMPAPKEANIAPKLTQQPTQQSDRFIPPETPARARQPFNQVEPAPEVEPRSFPTDAQQEAVARQAYLEALAAGRAQGKTPNDFRPHEPSRGLYRKVGGGTPEQQEAFERAEAQRTGSPPPLPRAEAQRTADRALEFEAGRYNEITGDTSPAQFRKGVSLLTSLGSGGLATAGAAREIYNSKQEAEKVEAQRKKDDEAMKNASPKTAEAIAAGGGHLPGFNITPETLARLNRLNLGHRPADVGETTFPQREYQAFDPYALVEPEVAPSEAEVAAAVPNSQEVANQVPAEPLPTSAATQQPKLIIPPTIPSSAVPKAATQLPQLPARPNPIEEAIATVPVEKAIETVKRIQEGLETPVTSRQLADLVQRATAVDPRSTPVIREVYQAHQELTNQILHAQNPFQEGSRDAQVWEYRRIEILHNMNMDLAQRLAPSEVQRLSDIERLEDNYQNRLAAAQNQDSLLANSRSSNAMNAAANLVGRGLEADIASRAADRSFTNAITRDAILHNWNQQDATTAHDRAMELVKLGHENDLKLVAARETAAIPKHVKGLEFLLMLRNNNALYGMVTGMAAELRKRQSAYVNAKGETKEAAFNSYKSLHDVLNTMFADRELPADWLMYITSGAQATVEAQQNLLARLQALREKQASQNNGRQ